MKLLVADDDPVSLRLLEGNLQRWGHEVATARDGAEAWRLFQEGTFSLVISDWMMPGMDGLELVRRIRASRRPGYVYFILLTARAQKADVVEGMESGADDFITKPFDREELRVRLRAGERIVLLEHSLEQQNRALREAQTALVQSEKLASLGQLAAGMAHEINNPLAYVTNNLALLRQDMNAVLTILDKYHQGLEALRQGDAALASEVARLEEEADLPYFQENFARICDRSLEGLRRVRDIVVNLRDFARLEEAEVKEADLNAGLQSALRMLQHEIKKKELQIQQDLQPLPPVLCHPGKLNQVFLNLLLNAVQASEQQGVVTLRSRQGPDRKGVIIEVEDHGCGIPPANLPRIFEPFFTTKPVGQGTGLGLSVSFGIVRDHGGTIEATSQDRQGSKFVVHLPLQPPRPSRGEG